ncbi:MAG: SAM-dependent methyltransferase, partial [Nocardioides sp.]
MSASERRGATRTAVVWDVLRPILGAGSRDVLDIGGGTGGFAVKVAELGHRVTVVDPSPDAL